MSELFPKCLDPILLLRTNIHPISKTKESILLCDRMGVDLLDALSPHKGTDKDEEGGCGKVKIRDELIDNAKSIPRSDIDRGRKTK